MHGQVERKPWLHFATGIQFNSFKFSATKYNYKKEIKMCYEYTKIIKLNKVTTIVHKIIITI